MTDQRVFTLDEAGALLPIIVPLLETLRTAHRVMEDLHDDVISSTPTNGGGKVHREFLEASRAAEHAANAIEEYGVLLRDPESGLIDFRAERSGEEIFLCWRLGEEAIAWWHSADSGFAGRQPV